MAGRREKYRHNEEKEEERSEGIKKKSQIHTGFDCRYANVQWKIVPHSVLSQRQPLLSILLLDIPETELHPKPREIRPLCFYLFIDRSQYDCHKCSVLRS